MIALHIAAGPQEWRVAVLNRDGHRCNSQQHSADCGKLPRLEAHHIVYKSHLSKRAFWVVENGICLSYECHQEAHRTHNVSIGLARANAAVAAVNCIESMPIQRFRKKKAA